MVWTLRDIFINIFKHLSVILVLVFALSRIERFKNMIFKKPTKAETLVLIAFFGGLSIIGTYGFSLKDAIANTRAVGAIVGGLIAGPVVGLGAGIIAGVHRYLLGGLTVNAAFISVALQGYLAGKYFEYKKRRITWYEGFIAGIVLEIVHFLIVLAITRPFTEALHVVSLIAPPMIIVNSVGVAFFILMLDTTTEVQRIGTGFRKDHKQVKKKEKSVLPIKVDDKVIIVNFNDIYLIKAIGQKKTEFVTQRGNYVTNTTLKELEEKLARPKFLRTHKSFIVNTEKITEVIPWFNSTYVLVIEGCCENDIPVSRNYIREFNQVMGIQ